MGKHKLKVLLILFIISIVWIISFYFLNLKSINLSQKEIKQNQITHYIENFEKPNSDIVKDFADIAWSWDILKLKESYEIWDFIKTKKIVTDITNEIPDNSKLNKEQKTKKIVLKYIELWAILNTWNYYYKEKEVQVEVKKITDEIKSIDPEVFDNFYWNYYLWYSQEIIKEFTWALNYYNKALEYSSSDNKASSSIILNQIWHVYDLQWDMNKAYEYYFKAYNLNKQNYNVSINIARYLTRIWEYNKAKKFYEYSLNSMNMPLRSEIYFSLSSIELELNWLKPDINKSIEYAKLWIKAFPDYPMNYVALARWYYMLNDSKYNKDIEENLAISIKLNPNWYLAYKYLALHMFDKWKLNETWLLFLKSINVINNDMILMNNDRENIKIELENNINFILLVNSAKNDKNITMEIIWKTFENIDYWKEFIKNQISRNSFGLFAKTNGINEYVNLFK